MKKRPLPLGYFIISIAIASVFISATLTGDEKVGARNESDSDYLATIRQNQVTGQINPADYLKAMQQINKSNSDRSAHAYDFSWDLLGPNNLGGRTRAILFDNRDTSGMTMYAGSVLGGLFKSDNQGSKWYKIDEANGGLYASCITQAGNGDIYVGTGEGFNVQQYTVFGEWGYSGGLMGQGIFKSTDGLTFTQLSSTKPVINGNNQLEWGFINELAAHPANGALYAATNTGLKYSGDGGNTWQVAKAYDGTVLDTTSKDVKMAANGLVIAEVANKCYVSESGNPESFMLRSGDSTYNLPDTSTIGRIEFAIAPSNNDIIYALVVKTSGALYNVYRSDDKGATWKIVGPGGSANFNVFNTGTTYATGNGLFAATIEVFPDDPYHVLVGGYDIWEGKKYQEDGYYQWIVRSTSAANWLSIAFLWQGQHTYKFVPGSAKEIFVGTNGGISKGTLDEDLYQFQFMNNDYIAGQFYTVSPTMELKDVVGGAQDIGTIYIRGSVNPADSKRGEDIWTTQNNTPDGRTGGYCAWSVIYPTAVIYSRYPQPDGSPETFIRRNEFSGGPDWAINTTFSTAYVSTSFMPPFAMYENFTDYASTDTTDFKATRDYSSGAVVWVESQNGKRPFKHLLTAPIDSGETINVKDIISARFFIGGDAQVLMTKQMIQFDVSPEWFVISDSAHSGVKGKPQCLAYSSDANHIFVGTQKGKLYRISNVKYAHDYNTADVKSPYCVISTSQIPVYLPGTSTEISQVITSVAVDPNNDERVIITLGNYGNENYVYYSDNALDENPVFHSVQGQPGNGGLPQMPAYSSLFEMNADNNLVFVGTERGIYVTNNITSSNPTWVAENMNIGAVPVFMLKQQMIRKTNDTLVFINIDTTYVIQYGTNNYGVIYGATYGRGLISLDEFQKPVGIGESPSPLKDESDIRIYPNPAKDHVTVAFETSFPARVEACIYDLQGKLIRRIDLGTRPEGRQDAIISCGSIPSGTYIMRVTVGSNVSSSKFIIQ